MSLLATLGLVAGGASLGAPLRYLIDRAVQSRHDSLFPWGTVIVNVAGACLLGLLVGGGTAGKVPGSVIAGAGVGFCGALTTYSAFGYETVRLVEEGSVFEGCANVLVSITAGLGATWFGLTIASALWQ